MVTALARKYGVQVSTDGASWIKLGALTDFNVSENPTNQAADTYDTNGIHAFEKTMTGLKISAKFLRPTVGGVYDAGQQVLEATRFQFGTAARAYIRWYDKGGSTDAWSSYGLIAWTPAKSATGDVEEVAVTFEADGIVTRIANPYAATLLPVVTSVTPTGQAAGAAVNIFGANFTGLVAITGVKFAGTNATSFTLVNDQQITAVLPAGSAGLITVLVTTAAGASAATNNYTRA